ncbi:hypothetical protein [Tsukamurella sp. PLM1]|uniref:hypothetical protein n=1 Tax=Tsukamurella sp. PLM1 TaxID=2929795 RepID=UPI00353029C5
MSPASARRPRRVSKAVPEQVPGIPLTEPTEGVPEPLTTIDQFAECAAALRRGSGPVALDTERASGFTYSSRAYLIQIKRTGSGLFLLDPILEPEGLAR